MRRFSRESSMDEKLNYAANRIVEETLDICLERINNNGIVVHVDYQESPSEVFCRPVEISQVLLNLINNSYQAIAELDNPWIRIKIEEEDDMVLIKVIDSGKQISPVIIQKLFQPFFTTKDVGEGTGLGLSISRGIIEGHEGSLYFCDDSRNTTFVIKLPKSHKVDNQILHQSPTDLNLAFLQ